MVSATPVSILVLFMAQLSWEQVFALVKDETTWWIEYYSATFSKFVTSISNRHKIGGNNNAPVE